MSKRSEAIRTIKRRLKRLDERISLNKYPDSLSFDQAERSALIWALLQLGVELPDEGTGYRNGDSAQVKPRAQKRGDSGEV